MFPFLEIHRVMCSVTIRVDETIALSVSHDGGMENMEVKGIMQLSITFVFWTALPVPSSSLCSVFTFFKLFLFLSFSNSLSLSFFYC